MNSRILKSAAVAGMPAMNGARERHLFFLARPLATTKCQTKLLYSTGIVHKGASRLCHAIRRERCL